MLCFRDCRAEFSANLDSNDHGPTGRRQGTAEAVWASAPNQPGFQLYMICERNICLDLDPFNQSIALLRSSRFYEHLGGA
jgi:hypothetical protein